MTADIGLYLVARHGELQAFGVGAGRGGGWAPGARLRQLTLPLSLREVCQTPEGGEPSPRSALSPPAEPLV